MIRCALSAVPDAGDYIRIGGIVLIGVAVVILAVVFIIRGRRNKKK